MVQRAHNTALDSSMSFPLAQIPSGKPSITSLFDSTQHPTCIQACPWKTYMMLRDPCPFSSKTTVTYRILLIGPCLVELSSCPTIFDASNNKEPNYPRRDRVEGAGNVEICLSIMHTTSVVTY